MLRTHWLEIREFFQLISNIVDEEVGKMFNQYQQLQQYQYQSFIQYLKTILGNKVDKYVKMLGKGRKSASLRKKNYFKNQIYGYIQVKKQLYGM